MTILRHLAHWRKKPAAGGFVIAKMHDSVRAIGWSMQSDLVFVALACSPK
jgi:hypothetical protein